MKTPQKPAPDLNACPPLKGCFYNREKVSFPSRDTEYQAHTAWWLAQCSSLAYMNKVATAKELEKVGFDKVTFFDANGTHAFLAQHPGKDQRFAILAFRGTEHDSIDIFTDISLFPCLFPNENLVEHNSSETSEKLLYVHGGFAKGLHNVWGTGIWKDLQKASPQIAVRWLGSPGISNAICELEEGTDLYVTGHSLGGALAVLAAYKALVFAGNINLAGVYTFGAPSIAQRLLAKTIDKKLEGQLYRVVNDRDVVPRVPPLLPPLFNFHHVGRLIQYDRQHTRTNILCDQEPCQFFVTAGILLQTLAEGVLTALSLRRQPPSPIMRHRIQEYIGNLEFELGIQPAFNPLDPIKSLGIGSSSAMAIEGGVD